MEETERLRLISRQGQRFANPNSPDYYKAMAFVASQGFRAHTAGPPTTYLLNGGNYKLRGEAVEPGVLSAVTGHSRPVDYKGLDIRSSRGSSRRLLAEWIASPDNPPDGPGDGESDLAVPLRPRPGVHPQRPGQERRGNGPPGVAGLAGLAVHPERVEHQGDAPDHPAVQRLPAIPADAPSGGPTASWTATIAICGGATPFDWKPRSCGTACWLSADNSTPPWEARPSSPI